MYDEFCKFSQEMVGNIKSKIPIMKSLKVGLLANLFDSKVGCCAKKKDLTKICKVFEQTDF